MSRLLLQHLVNGNVFYVGVGCLLLAVSTRRRPTHRAERIAQLLAILGIILVGLSATPLLALAYCGLAVLTVFWILGGRNLQRVPSSSRVEEVANGTRTCEAVQIGRQRFPVTNSASRVMTILFVLSWLAAVGSELRWTAMPQLTSLPLQRLIVIADSLTAGIGEGNVKTWPKLLTDQGMEILDLSRMGATVSSTLTRIKEIDLPAGVVLIELGGNDLLGTTSVDDFRMSLNELLQIVAAGGREVLMFELPLPPFCNRFGQVQRELAERYRVHLIPKRVLANVIFAEGATSDSLHLTQSGQDDLARVVAGILRGTTQLEEWEN